MANLTFNDIRSKASIKGFTISRDRDQYPKCRIRRSDGTLMESGNSHEIMDLKDIYLLVTVSMKDSDETS